MQLFNRHVSTRSLTVFAGELVLIFGSVALAAAVQHTPDLPVEPLEDPRSSRWSASSVSTTTTSTT